MKAGLMIALGLIIFLAGCAVTPSRLEVNSGAAFHYQKVNQILNPAAGKNLKPVEGLDAKATEITLEKYRKSFEKPPEPGKFLMEIGSNR
jgi:hypothetical protein